MPRIMKIFRLSKNADKSKKPSKEKKSKSAVFRTKDSTPSINVEKAIIKRSSAPAPIEQAITWTMSDDSVSPMNAEPLDATNQQQAPEPSPSQETVASKFIFTEEDLMENEMNHIRELTKLESDINRLKKTTEDLVRKHATELAKKDFDYVELLIQVGEKEEELEIVRAELENTKEELKTVSCKLIQSQHQLFEESNKSFWTSLFN